MITIGIDTHKGTLVASAIDQAGRDRFTTGWAMGTLTLVYVIAHLLAFVVLGAALGRARVVPPWAAWALILTSPLTVIAFPTHQQWLLYLVIGLWMAGSVPAALAVWRARGDLDR